jgi:hydrogenase maturation protein HypF
VSAVEARRVAVRVEGVVQGVGFRPAVFRLAEELGMAGFVRNDSRGVELEVEGAPEDLERFLAALTEHAPPLARIDALRVRDVAARGERGFSIAASERSGSADALIAADGATCDACLAELFDPGDRRHRYPFLNCTDCGPRFTIVTGVPYDRPMTTMAGFAMCDACRAEYEDPRDRRFHAQPTACPDCGPAARLLDGDGARSLNPLPGGAADAVAGAAALLRDGAIVAVKGLGGYHLACRAGDERAVAALRARKHREDKPFALMVPAIAAARELVELDATSEAMLRSRARPIVLAPRLPGAPVAAAAAPASRELGVMLPYSPLHHVLLADAGCALVMTSGNRSDEPIAYHDGDALERLAGIADAFLVHDRPIHMRTDDSVVRAVRGRPQLLRRSRGYVPESLPLPVACREPLLACGAQLKNTACVARGRRAWIGHHIGDLGEAETVRSFAEGIAHFERLFAVDPAVVAHDLHPDLHSTRYALEREGVRTIAVQHHHAHLASCLAEHGETGPAVGAIFDGTGLGADGTIWGGEILTGDLIGFRRSGHLWPVRLPGGEAAVREPWRMACAWLLAAGVAAPAELVAGAGAQRWQAVEQLARSGFSAPLTTSAGRLFDAVAALCGVRATVTYEGQAAIELEALAEPGETGRYQLPVTAGLVIDARPAIRAIVRDRARGVAAGIVSARLHRGLSAATAEACARAAASARLDTVVLSGGVFQNRLLSEDCAVLLEQRGLRVLMQERVPPGDGGISFGQAAVAAARLAAGDEDGGAATGGGERAAWT